MTDPRISQALEIENRLPDVNTPLAVNTGQGQGDGNLLDGWVLLPTNYSTAPRNARRPSQGRGWSFDFECPSARYNPLDQYYYVFGGGTDIQLSRSKDLSAHSWSDPVLMARPAASPPPPTSYP